MKHILNLIKGNHTFKLKTRIDKYFVKSLIYYTLLISIKRKYTDTLMKLKVACSNYLESCGDSITE